MALPRILACVPEEHFDKPTSGGVIAAVAASTAGLLVAGSAGPTAGALTLPVMQALLNFLGSRVEHAREKAARVLADAAAENGVGEDQLIDMAESSSQKVELAAEVLNAAARATTEQKLKALAGAFARGVRGDDYIAARERLMVAALADLEPLHVDVMSCLLSRPPMYRSEEDWRGAMSNRPAGAYGWLPGEVIERLPEVSPVIDGVFAALVRHGLVVDTAIGTVGYKARYAVTEFGLWCLGWLEDHEAVRGPGRGA